MRHTGLTRRVPFVPSLLPQSAGADSLGRAGLNGSLPEVGHPLDWCVRRLAGCHWQHVGEVESGIVLPEVALRACPHRGIRKSIRLWILGVERSRSVSRLTADGRQGR